MASQVDEAERRVRDQRALIEQKLASLEGRVGDDLAHARSRLQHHVSNTQELMPGGQGLIEQVEAHPVAAMAGGLGIGVAAGMLGGRSVGSRHNQHADVGHDGSNGMAGMTMFLGSMSNSLLSPLRPYVEDAAKQVIAGFADRRGTQPEGVEAAPQTQRGEAPGSAS